MIQDNLKRHYFLLKLKSTQNWFLLFFALLILNSCSKDENNYQPIPDYPAVKANFGNSIDLENLDNYANQDIPSYITKDNTFGNQITDRGATLG